MDQTTSPNRNNTLGTSSRVWQSAYFLLTVALGGMFVWTLFPGVDVRLSLGLIFAALLVLTLKRWTGALLLAIIQLHLYYCDPRSLLELNTAASFLWVLMPVFLLVVVSRFRTLRDGHPASRSHFTVAAEIPQQRSQSHSSESRIARLKRTALATFGDLWKKNMLNPDDSQLVFDELRRVVGQLIKILGIVILSSAIASMILSSVPLSPNANGFTIQEYRLKPSGYRVIMIALKLFCIGLVLWVAINELIWRNHSKRQSSVYLRSTFLSWMHRDLGMVVRRRLKQRRSGVQKLETPRVKEPDPSGSTLFDDLKTS